MPTSTAFHPSSCPSVQTIMSQLRYKNIVGDGDKSLSKVEINYIHQSIKQVISSQNQADQAWLTPGTSLLALPSHLVHLPVPRNMFPEDGFNAFSWVWSKTDRPVVILLECLAFLEDECNTWFLPVAVDFPWSPQNFKGDREQPFKDTGQLSQHKGLGNLVGEVWSREDTWYISVFFVYCA